MSRVFLFWLGQEREAVSLIFLALFFQGSGLSFLLLVNVMSYITSTTFCLHSVLASAQQPVVSLFSPIVRTVNRSPDLLAGFDLF